MDVQRIKQIKIKTGVVKRLTKEKEVYEKEAEQQKQRVQNYKDQGKDEHDVRKQEEVLREALMMIPDCQRRLSKAYGALKSLLEGERDLAETEEFQLAEKILSEAIKYLPSGEDGLHY